MNINFPIIIGAALADSVNPAVFTLLIALLTSLEGHTNKSHKTLNLQAVSPSNLSKGKILTQGAAFITGFFITSIFSGAFLIPSFFVLSNISPLFYPLLGTFITAIGLIELFKHVKPDSKLSQHSIFSHKLRAQKYSKKLSTSPIVAFALGFMVSLAELPFSGGIYLATLSLMNLTAPSLQIIPTLVIYNLIIAIPLAIILLATTYSISTDQYKFWQRRRHSGLHLGIASLLIILGIWLLST